MAVYISNSVSDTEKLAARLAEKLRGGEVIAFTGSMGMGKTAFTRGLVLALGGGDVVSSPTFALVNEYETRLTVQHFDMYRVSGWDDLYSTGFFDYLDTDNVLVIEWSENIDGALPDNTIRIDIQKGETETERVITIEGVDL
ncbi:MAG: tRNA (adenosine(37)-N6)-threonylcarbamoyltransferase complex ATPase subunit type 1 TsaE [Hominenteromicrobium sp.]